MTPIPALAAWLIAAYLAGAAPAGYIITKLLKGFDIRKHGSGNPGATNVFRVVGAGAGAATLLFDFSKGFLPVFLAAKFFDNVTPLFLILTGLAAIAGHVWTVFLRFRGGKGVATGAGVFVALMPLPALYAACVFAAVLFATRYVSVSSMTAAATLPLWAFLHGEPLSLILFCALAAIIIIARHRSNITKLIAGTEGKI